MAEERTKAAQSHCSGFEQVGVTAARRAIDLMWPGMSSQQIADALGARITASNVRQWRTGLRPIPPWVRELIAARAAALADAIGNAKAGPGSQAGWRNVRGYQLNRLRATNAKGETQTSG